ncbi:Chemotaxis protein CheW [bioreactor metagenome]|uniref:Chemotaxis protein CheW n=1 Tax=bioreactor metagenome TaxID=1076179 RepID=A0A644XX37_9ZZZZ
MGETLEKLLDLETEDVMKGRFLSFQIGGELYGIEIRTIVEIIGIQPITEVPEMPAYVKGIINLRGSIIPVMDVRLRFKIAPRDYDDRTCVIVIQLGTAQVGLIVDGVSEVLSIADEDISDRPHIGGAAGGGYIRRIGKAGRQVIQLVDCSLLLSGQEEDAISGLSA